mmetsp:Transcript_5473/g.11180  ORF Transcript_5473/g.11180 Transcript_5473/m.11180 type:complete len:202 (-) Transcript_5473:16-621(-)
MVGAIGLRGCITDERPHAKKGTFSPGFMPLARSAPRSVALATASGGMAPYTTERLQPAFSKTSPPAITREMPPPPFGRSHTSSWNLPLPSSASISAQIAFCASRHMASNLRRIDSLPSTPRTKVSGAASIATCVSHPMLTGFWSVLSSAFSTVARDGRTRLPLGADECTKAPAEATRSASVRPFTMMSSWEVARREQGCGD